MVEFPHQARRYGYKLKKRFREDPFSVIILYSLLLGMLFLAFAFRGLIATVFIKPIGIVNPGLEGVSETNNTTEETQGFDPVEGGITLESTGTYTVKSGDTLAGIAEDLEIEWEELAELNNIEPPYSLTVGQELKLP